MAHLGMEPSIPARPGDASGGSASDGSDGSVAGSGSHGSTGGAGTGDGALDEPGLVNIQKAIENGR